MPSGEVRMRVALGTVTVSEADLQRIAEHFGADKADRALVRGAIRSNGMGWLDTLEHEQDEAQLREREHGA